MRPSAKRVLEEALALPEHERIEVLDELLIKRLKRPTESLADVEAAWADEIAHRLKAVETGGAKPISWENARKIIFGSRDGG